MAVCDFGNPGRGVFRRHAARLVALCLEAFGLSFLLVLGPSVVGGAPVLSCLLVQTSLRFGLHFFGVVSVGCGLSLS